MKDMKCKTEDSSTSLYFAPVICHGYSTNMWNMPLTEDHSVVLAHDPCMSPSNSNNQAVTESSKWKFIVYLFFMH